MCPKDFQFLDFKLVVKLKNEEVVVTLADISDDKGDPIEHSFPLPGKAAFTGIEEWPCDTWEDSIEQWVDETRESAARLQEIPRHAEWMLEEEERVKTIGKALFEMLIPSSPAALRDSYKHFYGKATGESHTNMRLRLEISRELAHIPWEVLHSPENVRPKEFVSRTISVVRSPIAEDPPVKCYEVEEGPLNLLLISGSSLDEEETLLQEQEQAIKKSLRQAEEEGRVAVKKLEIRDGESSTLDALCRHLREENVHILHFMGHGSYDIDDFGPAGFLTTVVKTDEGGEKDFDEKDKEVAGSIKEGLDGGLRLVVLNACVSARGRREFSGVAQALLNIGIPAVLAMQYSIGDPAAQVLASNFYEGLMQNLSVDDAVRHVRNSLRRELRGTLEWITPVLFLRGDGELWKFGADEAEGGDHIEVTISGNVPGQLAVGKDITQVRDILKSKGVAVGPNAKALVVEGDLYILNMINDEVTPVITHEQVLAHLKAIVADETYERWRDDRYPDDQARPLPMNVSLYDPGSMTRMEELPKEDLMQVMERGHERVVILGGRGRGKTTALERLMWVIAKKSLDNPEDPVIPIFVPLERYGREPTLLPLVRTSLNRHGVLKLSPEDTDLLLRTFRCFILLDGLHRMERFPKEGVNPVVNLMDNYTEHRYCLTCRTQDYRDHRAKLRTDLGDVHELVVQELEDDPIAQLRNQVLDRLAQDFGVKLVAEGGTPIRSRRRAQRLFREIYRDNQLFGGRQIEWAKLERFLDNSGSGYLFVTGPTGFGKTALLANWAKSLDSGAVVHFVTPDVDASEKFCFQSLCEQLLELHDLGCELPEEERYLRLLYADLLELPPSEGRRIVVVLDGLEESLFHWAPRKPGKDIFPHKLAQGVYVVFSAGSIADKDWLGELGLPLPDDRIVSLGPLTLDEIKDVLKRSQLVAGLGDVQDTVAQRLYDLSEGDPFYVKELLKHSAANVEKLRKPPIGLDNYLKEWWKDGCREIGEEAFGDLTGTLLLARAGLRQKELIALSADDAIQGKNFDRLIEQASKYVVGSEYKGYRLSSARIRDFVADRLTDDIDTYRARMADYCLRWAEPGLEDETRDYMLLHGVYHLADGGRWQDLLSLLGPEWMGTKWDRFGSYSTVVQDLDRAARAALEQEPPDFAGVAALCVARQTGREIMLGLPTPLLAAWVRMGKIERVLALLAALGHVKGRAAEPLTAVARELLAMVRQDDDALVAADLLARALGMLHRVRSSVVLLEALSAITDLLSAGHGLADPQRLPLLEQAASFAASLREPALRAAALGLVAEALASSESEWDQSRTLVEQAREAIEKIYSDPDRLVARAYLLPALKQLDPDSALTNVQAALDEVSDPFEASSLTEVPLHTLLAKWTPEETPHEDRAAALVTEIGQLCIDRDEPNGFILGFAIRALCELGQGMTAIELVQSAWERSGIEGARAVLAATTTLNSVNPVMTKDWLARAQAFTDYSHHEIHINRELFAAGLACGLAEMGDWDSALSLLGTVRPLEKDDAAASCLRLAGQSFSTDGPALRSMVDRLTELCQDCDTANQAEIYAVAGQVLLPQDAATAEGYISRATGLCLGNLPEGHTDALRQLLALALHEEGDFAGARAAIEPMTWVTARVSTYTRLIEATPATEPGVLQDYGEGLLRTLHASEGKPLFANALMEATRAVNLLTERGAKDVAEPLCDYVFEAATDLMQYDEFIECIAAEATARTRLDGPTGLAHFDGLIHTVGQWLRSNAYAYIPSHTVATIYHHLGSIAPIAPNQALARLEQARLVTAFFADISDRVELESGYALALASIDTERATNLLRKQIASIAELCHVPPPAPHLMRMIAEFTGRKVGPRYLQAEVAKDIGGAIVAAADNLSDEAGKLLGELLAAIGTIDSPNDRAQALADFFDNCGQVPADLQHSLSDVYAVALDLTGNLPDPDLSTYVVTHAIDAFCQFGDLQAARRAADLLSDTNARDQAESTINIARERMELATLSPFERAFVDVRDPTIEYAVVHGVKVENEAEELLTWLANELAEERISSQRYSLIEDPVRLMIAPARDVGGTALIAAIIRDIEDFDQRFLQAASLIAQPDE